MARSYNGWSASPNPNNFGGIQPLVVAGESFAPGVRRGVVYTVLKYVAEQLHRRVEPVYKPGWHQADDWGYAYRQNRNANNLSCHASGTAIDYNATRHPNGRRGTFSSKQVSEIRKILREVDNVVRWGGDFTGTPDEMHFEINADHAAVKRVADRLNGKGGAPARQGMDATTLASAMGCSHATASKYLNDFVKAMKQAGCTTVNRAAMFCAQIGHESAGLKYMEEIASGAAYEGRRDLGNVHPGDGRRFKGRGPIQLTGRHNYGEFGKWAKARGLVSNANYFVNNPHVVATSKWGFLAAAWYWTAARPQINSLCDKADLVGVTRAINGGTNGLADRRRRWNHCRSLGTRLLPGTGASRSADISIYYDEDYPMILPKGGKLKPGGASKVQWATVTVPSVLREHDLVIGSQHGVHIETIHTWKYLHKGQMEARWGRSNTKPGGVGALLKNAWIHHNAGGSVIVPKGVAVLKIAYASDGPVSISLSPRGV